MSVFFAVVNEQNVVVTTKEVASDVMNVDSDGNNILFSAMTDHIAITDFTICEPSDKYDVDNEVWLKAGLDSQGGRRWYAEDTGLLMQNVYDGTGAATGAEEVT
jgi:hypothetical protein